MSARAIDAAATPRLDGHQVDRSGKPLICAEGIWKIFGPHAEKIVGTADADLPRGERVEFGTVGSLEEILLGPSRVSDGSMNFVGALRRAMATTGYSDLKEFQRVEVTVSA